MPKIRKHYFVALTELYIISLTLEFWQYLRPIYYQETAHEIQGNRRQDNSGKLAFIRKTPLMQN